MTVTRNNIKSIFFSLIVFFIFIGTVEMLLRTTHLFNASISCSRPDDLIGWSNSPNCDFKFNEENDHTINVRFNNHGYRDKDRTLKKPSDVYRIAMLGDSFIEALQVELEHTFFSLTEDKLNGNHSKQTELINFGRSGSTQTEELLILRNKVMKFSPDMVLLFFFPGNDIKEVSSKTVSGSLRPFYQISQKDELVLDTSFTESSIYKIKSSINIFKQNSALISLLATRYNAYKQARGRNNLKTEVTEISPDALDSYLTLCTENPDETYSTNYQLNKRLIKTIAEYCKDHGVKFMLVTLDTQAYVKDLEEKYILADPTFNSYFFEDDMKNFANSLNIEYLGIQRIFAKHNKDTSTLLHWGKWGHWNYEGHKVVALALTRKLESLIYSE